MSKYRTNKIKNEHCFYCDKYSEKVKFTAKNLDLYKKIVEIDAKKNDFLL